MNLYPTAQAEPVPAVWPDRAQPFSEVLVFLHLPKTAGNDPLSRLCRYITFPRDPAVRVISHHRWRAFRQLNALCGKPHRLRSLQAGCPAARRA